MLLSASFQKDFRCFHVGDCIKFRPGVNLLVGDQGTGKSSLLFALSKMATSRGDPPLVVETDCLTTTYGFDFEKDNLRIKSDLSKDPVRFHAQMAGHFVSHGQFVNAILLGCLEKPEAATFFMDEPDMALSIRSIRRLSELLKELAAKGHQVIASAHNPYLIESFPEVYSLEHRRWMSSGEFIESQI
jgi:predicted ATPase